MRYEEHVGKFLMYKIRSNWSLGLIESDPRFSGGIKCNGISLSSIVSSADEVLVVEKTVRLA